MKPKRNPQINMLKKQKLSYGGEILKTRAGRTHGRTLDTKNTMHMVLRSSLAKGSWSFSQPGNKQKVSKIFSKFSSKYGVKIYSVAYVGNHIHCQIKLSNRYAYFKFIRGLTAAIAMAISGASRWNKNALKGKKFWDYRPFTRVVRGLKAVLNLKDYIHINELEGYGYHREQARFIIGWRPLDGPYLGV